MASRASTGVNFATRLNKSAVCGKLPPPCIDQRLKMKPKTSADRCSSAISRIYTIKGIELPPTQCTSACARRRYCVFRRCCSQNNIKPLLSDIYRYYLRWRRLSDWSVRTIIDHHCRHIVFDDIKCMHCCGVLNMSLS